jgi:hypothetical protein
VVPKMSMKVLSWFLMHQYGQLKLLSLTGYMTSEVV